ncbi:ZZ-type zinc finger-containing protein 3 isoform X3 [Lepisosteus oculatus]|uniref:ZZ-type zinc finger-containing protein 3 isoform X3 n=1 Tax=Lepisosteus oculatus TaxID=7918 RepID=UPI003723252F
MAASRSTRVTRSSVGINGLDDNFCGRTLRNRSIAHPEDSSPNPPQRARSPKKKQDCQQPPSKGNTSSRLADSKQPQGSRESWMSPRKRGLSSSEKDSNPDKADNCDRRPSREVSPVLKRIKRCPRSGDAPSSEEDSPVKAEKPAGDPKEAEGDADSPGPKRARRCLLLDDYDKGEIKKVDSPAGKNSQPGLSDEAGQVTNGLDEQDLDAGKNCPEDASKPHRAGSCEPAQDVGAVPASARNKSLSLLNGGKADSALDPDDVPCTNSHSEQAEPSAPTAPAPTEGGGGGGSSGSAAVENERAPPRPAAAASSPEGPPAGKEPEEEVDVVGDGGGGGGSARECGAENTNGGLCAVQDNKPTSGEPEPPVGLDGSPAEAASFTEPQEHRYTLRTSPRRAACSRGSPHKLNSPSRDSGPAKEEDREGSESRTLPSGEAASDSEPGARPDPAPCDGPPGEHGDGTVKLTGESGLSDSRLSRSAKELVSSHATEEDEDEEDPDVYYFESDHLALKHSKDYQRLLQTIAVLEAQRTQAILDLECLARRQKEALSNPIGFVEQLQKQRVVQLPEIAWDQYTSGLGDFQKEFRNKKRNTRRLKLIFDKVGLPARPKSPLDSKKEAESSALYSALPSSDGPDLASGSRTQQMIRGRVCDQSKPDTFNQLWTVEEQKKLEQLLLKFPPEEVESKRWQKIADELGNRTAKQVASRVQKYFIKLTKAGIPVPGRTPNLCMYSKKASNKRQHHLNKHLYRPSTFMTSYEPPVYMDDDDDRSSFYSNLQDPAAEESDEESIPVEYRHLPEYKELMQLKKLKKQKLHEMCTENSLVQHIGFKCDNCGVEPIQGVRWHCQDCSPENAIDFCTSCSDCLLKTETHKPDHALEAIYRAETFLDRDYCMPHSTGYNYLDPNYFPANR